MATINNRLPVTTCANVLMKHLPVLYCCCCSESILGTNKPGFLRPWGPIYQTLDAGSLKAENQETAPFYNAVLAELIPESDIKVQVQFKKFKIFGILPVTAPDSAKGELTVSCIPVCIPAANWAKTGALGHVSILAHRHHAIA